MKFEKHKVKKHTYPANREKVKRNEYDTCISCDCVGHVHVTRVQLPYKMHLFKLLSGE